VTLFGAAACLIYMIYNHDLDPTAISIMVLAAIIGIMKLALPYVNVYLKYAREISKYNLSQPIILSACKY